MKISLSHDLMGENRDGVSKCYSTGIINDDLGRIAKNDMQLKRKYEEEFLAFWKMKSEDELWGLLFLERIVEGCTSVLLRHPLDGSWITKNPNKEKEKPWWQIKKNEYGPQLYNCPLPCKNCSGRG